MNNHIAPNIFIHFSTLFKNYTFTATCMFSNHEDYPSNLQITSCVLKSFCRFYVVEMYDILLLTRKWRLFSFGLYFSIAKVFVALICQKPWQRLLGMEGGEHRSEEVAAVYWRNSNFHLDSHCLYQQKDSYIMKNTVTWFIHI